MRVIGGTARGRRLAPLKGDQVRPTADRVKEALFSILTSRLQGLDGCRALDICAGTGNLGIEALSRGAVLAVFIDSSRDSTSVIRKNLEITGFSSRSRVIVQEALPALRKLKDREELFQLIFCDPPYGKGILLPILELLGDSTLVADDGIVAVEHAAREAVPEQSGSLERVDSRTYGDTAITLYAPLNRG